MSEKISITKEDIAHTAMFGVATYIALGITEKVVRKVKMYRHNKAVREQFSMRIEGIAERLEDHFDKKIKRESP